MSFTPRDARSLTSNLNEATILLAAIFSWLTTYEWYVDLAIVLFLSHVNTDYVKRWRLQRDEQP